jgi:hypothetical protein
MKPETRKTLFGNVAEFIGEVRRAMLYAAVTLAMFYVIRAINPTFAQGAPKTCPSCGAQVR